MSLINIHRKKSTAAICLAVLIPFLQINASDKEAAKKQYIEQLKKSFTEKGDQYDDTYLKPPPADAAKTLKAKKKVSMGKKAKKKKYKATNHRKQDTRLSAIPKGSYESSGVYPSSTTIKFTKPFKLKIFGQTLNMHADSYVSFYNKSGFVASVYSFYDPDYILVPRTIKKKKYKKWVKVSLWFGLNEDGTLRFACPLENDRKFKIGKYNIPYHTYSNGLSKIWFHRNGSVAELHIKNPVTLKAFGKKMTFEHQDFCGGDLAFNPKGVLRAGVLNKPAKFNKTRFPKSTHLRWEKGKVVYAGVYPGKFVSQGWQIGPKKGCWASAYYHSNGKISRISGLGKNRTYKGKTYKKGQNLWFNENGDVTYVSND